MNEPPVRLLSIDGGGVRGLSALVLLEQLMEHVNDQRESQGLQKQEPWELFDLMGGTSTGGYVWLSRLARVTVADSRQAYCNTAWTPAYAARPGDRCIHPAFR